MHIYINEHFDHLLFALLLFARASDIFTTWLATPRLAHEANPVTKKFGWWFGVATVLLSFSAYVSESFALALLGISLCVCASNASKLWLMRTLGEAEYHALLLTLMRRSGLAQALMLNCFPALFYLVLGLFICFVDAEPSRGYYLGMGIWAFGVAILVFYPVRYYRVYAASRATG